MIGWHRINTVTAMVVVATAGNTAMGQWIDRAYSLNSGWNAVYLEIDPVPELADDLFAGLPIAEVWALTPTVNVDGLPDCQDPNDPECTPRIETVWDIWLPPSDPASVVTDLRIIRGGRVYLIRADAPLNLAMAGRPNGTVTRWHEGYNLQGFHVEDDPNDAPTFGEYLAGAPMALSPTIREVLSDGSTAELADAANERIRPSAGYWVRSPSESDYDGPIRIDAGTLRGIDYASRLVEHPISIENRTNAPSNVQIALAPSSDVPSTPPDLPMKTGAVPLRWLEYVAVPVASAIQWHDLTTASFTLAASGDGASRTSIRLAIDRSGLAAALLDASGSGSQYESLLVVRDGFGYRRWVPVAGQVLGSIRGTSAAGTAAERPGLYYGRVRVNEVQWVTAGARVWTNDDPNDPMFTENGRCDGGDLDGQSCSNDAKCPGGQCTGYCIGGANADQPCAAGTDCPSGRCSAETGNVSLRPTSTAFTFPILVHLSVNGTYKMLTEVALLWKPPDDQSQTPGRYVLVTPACDPILCDPLEAASIQDGEPFARRLGTAAFSFGGDLLLSGGFADALGGSFDILPDDPLNPFRHKFHPDHDCDQFGECYDVTRSFILDFESTPPQGDTRPGWGDRILGGTYQETIMGLYRDSVAVGGRFEMTRVSSIDALNVE